MGIHRAHAVDIREAVHHGGDFAHRVDDEAMTEMVHLPAIIPALIYRCQRSPELQAGADAGARHGKKHHLQYLQIFFTSCLGEEIARHHAVFAPPACPCRVELNFNAVFRQRLLQMLDAGIGANGDGTAYAVHLEHVELQFADRLADIIGLIPLDEGEQRIQRPLRRGHTMFALHHEVSIRIYHIMR